MSRRALQWRLDASTVRALLPRLQQNLAARATAVPSHAASVPPKASVAAVFRWREKQKETLELLFVRRSINERDTWSGQVAFPGGRRQKRADDADAWESSLETARRETWEEIGLDLTKPHVHWIGTLPIIQTHLRSFFVGTEIFFLDASADEHAFEPVIQAKEIADVFWVDVQELFNPARFQPLVWPLEDMVPAAAKYSRVRDALYALLGDLYFGSIYLPRPTHAAPDDDPAPRHRHDFILWGLTMRMVADMFELAECPLPGETDVMPRFESKALGDVFLLVHRQPEVALRRALAIAAACAAIGVISRL